MFGLASARRQSLRTAAGEPWDLAAVPRPAAFVPESMAVYNSLETFKAANVRVALVLS